MKSVLRQVIVLSLLFIVACSPYSCADISTDIPDMTIANGHLGYIDNQRILDLWGTEYEMGYAHGYLVGDLIKMHIESVASKDVSTYLENVSFAEEHFLFYPEYLDEINGIVAGMIDRGQGYITVLKRNVSVGDIKLWNDGPEQRFCSSFGVWDKTIDGNNIIARNLDLPLDWAIYQIMIVREPANGLKTISWGMPGWVGIQAGINEYGITVTANAGGDVSASVQDYYPVIPVHRYILEHTTPDNYLTEPLNIVNAIDEWLAINIQIGAPDIGQDNPVYYVEDSTVNAVRFAGDGITHIIATNHMLLIGTNQIDKYSQVSYQAIEDGLNDLYSTGDDLVSTAEAFSLLRKVEANHKLSTTIFCIVFRPNQMSFDVSMSDGNQPAPEMQPLTYSWTDLFPNHDVADSSPP